MSTGQRMKARRKELGLSAEYIANHLNLSPATIYRYENGDIDKVPGDILEPLAAILQTTPAHLMGWDDYSNPIEFTVSTDELQIAQSTFSILPTKYGQKQGPKVARKPLRKIYNTTWTKQA